MAEADNIPKLNDTFSDEKDISSKNDETSLKSKHILRKRQFSGLNRTGSKNVFVNSKTHFKVLLTIYNHVFAMFAILILSKYLFEIMSFYIFANIFLRHNCANVKNCLTMAQ